MVVHIVVFSVIAAGSTDELKCELSAFDDKVSKMERSMQQVYRLRSEFVNTVRFSNYFYVRLLSHLTTFV